MEKILARPSSTDEFASEKPVVETVDPLGRGTGSPLAKSETMTAIREKMKFHRDTCFLEIEVDLGKPFGNIGTVVGGSSKKGRRGILARNNAVGSSRIDESLEVRTIRRTINGVRGIRGGMEFHRGNRTNLTTCREAQHSYGGRIDIPFRGTAADKPDGPLHVGDGMVIHGISGAFFGSEAVV